MSTVRHMLSAIGKGIKSAKAEYKKRREEEAEREIAEIFKNPPEGVFVDRYPPHPQLPFSLPLDDGDFEKLIVATSVGVIDGRKIPCRRKKSLYPHVVEVEGGLFPEPGYTWVDCSAKGDYRVTWKSGSEHPDIPHVIASEEEGVWCPELGYHWNGPRSVGTGFQGTIEFF